VERYRNGEVERYRLRGRSYAKVAVGLAGFLAELFLSLQLTGTAVNISSVIVGLIAIAVAIASSLWLVNQGFEELKNTRPLPSSHQHRSIRGSRQEGSEKSAERQLLEVIERNGEITPARAALQTTLTVEEAEQLLSDLAQKGHLDVRVEGSRLVYSL
jgi:hypothetical protein